MFPASVPVHAAAALTVTVTASVTSQVRVQGLYRATKAPELTPFSRNVAHSAGDRTSETTTIASNVQGDVVALSVDAVTAGIKRGTVYVVVQLASYAVTLTVARGYVYEGVPLVLGQFIEPGPGGGEGFLRTIDIADAVPGAQFATQTVPTNAVWKVDGFKGNLVASAVAGTRQFRIDYTDGTNVIAAAVAIGKTIAARTNLYRGAIGLTGNFTGDTAAADGDVIVFPLPDILLREASTLIFLTLNGDPTATTGDDWDDTGFLQIEEWLAPP